MGDESLFYDFSYGLRLDSYKDMKFDGFNKDDSFKLNWEWEWKKDVKFDGYCFDSCKDMKFDSFKDDYSKLNWECQKDVNVIDMLPNDPFEMNISGGCTMIRGWIHDNDDDDSIGYIKISDTRPIGDETGLDDTPTNGLFLFDNKNKVLHSINNEHVASCCNYGVGDFDGDGVAGAPHDGLFFALGYLGIRDLFSVERVCKSLRDAVRHDPLLWRDIRIDQPPGESFDDDSLLRITDRASGSLQSLTLVKCLKISDDGLKNVCLQNPGLTKLSVLGCNGLSMEGLLNNLKSLESSGGGGIKRLRIGGFHSITMEQYEELKKVLSINNQNQPISPKARFYQGGQLYLSLDDDRPIDIESCPRCQQLRQVYDCPAESCESRHSNCKACTFCIPRCINCGCCFNERDYMETFCLDFLCLDCLTYILGFPDGEEEDISIPSGFHQQASYHFCLYG
uniref:F-box protein SKIP14-like n=1 Tax=Erigeron canadensis TaxID=72917 RepID=UPI001CB8AAC5|nr:F-box protein SKIP14-like [Erigeron canadensis]